MTINFESDPLLCTKCATVLESYFRLCPICGTPTGAGAAIEEENVTPDHVAKVRELHPRAYERWSDEEDARLRALLESGLTLERIAIDLQRQPSAIRSRIQKLV